ncbi:phosphoprotein [Parrot bornavirus 5]|uniref:Phosphoprotein n=1 Tax=Parrot bornavirus 5 TaxID=1884879 RepID=D3KVQ5_9MONO|nr:phosphoprotein [Parrot bornavirus 5]ALJ30338.1 phosphoprotein [Parrot bornavirus 5]URS73025.1 P protein [Parrot bornavirus 5]BAI78308.1 phosphoprotein [Parrot bornavirus 5]BAV57484.1 phosphoprotein [Parrot bornavirus 5]
MASRPSSLVDSLEDEDDLQTVRRVRSRSPRRKKIPRDALTQPVEQLLKTIKKNPSMVSDPDRRTGREQLSNDELIKQLVTELAENSMIENEGLRGSLDDISTKIEHGFESLSSLQVEAIQLTQKTDYADSIKMLGENIKILDRSMKMMMETMKLMMEKIDLLYASSAIGKTNVPMLPSHPGPSRIYPSLPTAPTAEELDILP